MRTILVSLALLGWLFAPSGVARASGGRPIVVTYTACETITSSHSAGGNTLLSGSDAFSWNGTFTGSFVATEHDVLFADGSLHFQGRGTFTGLVDGKAGSFVDTFDGLAQPDGSFSGHWAAGQASGDLRGFHAEGDLVGVSAGPAAGCDVPFAGSFSGEMHFTH